MSDINYKSFRYTKKSPKIDDLLSKIKTYLPNTPLDQVEKAHDYATAAHKGQKRKSGEPYFVHPLEVAFILAELKLDVPSIAASILHDVVEDTDIALADLENEFGKEIAVLVDSLTKLSKMAFASRHDKQAESFRKMLIAMAQDLRVILIKLADRLHNMRTLQYLPETKQRVISQETIDIYAPLANRMGINWMKTELEDLCFRYIKPESYYKLVEKIQKTKKERDKYIEEVKKTIKQSMKDHGYDSDVVGRPKHLYSVFKKMEARNMEFEQIFDIIAFRMLMANINECYEALGVLHSLWKPVPGRFKDYIAMPKPNMYQSLHTTLIGPHGERIEVQIKTKEMHEVAEDGIAAHWIYKDGGKISKEDIAKFSWLKQMMEWQQDVPDSTEFIETVKVDLFHQDVYVFTPKGEVKEFPKGSTPIDFAYSVHTEVGHHCVGAKVNGRIVPLKYKLQNGDTLEIITNKNHCPNKDWLKYVVTSRAKAKIRAIVKSEERKRSIEIGHGLLEKELKKFGLSLNKLEKKGELRDVVLAMKFGSNDDLYAGIGYGKVNVANAAKKFLSQEEIETIEKEKQSIIGKVVERTRKKSKSSVIVKGVDDMLVRFARCCSPIYGDEIVGFITRGRGITIHTTNCNKSLDMDTNRKVEVSWDKKEKSERSVWIRIVTIDKPGILADLSQAIAAFGVNITSANIKTTKDKKAICLFEITITDITQLYNMMTGIEKVDGVISVDRSRG